MSAPIDGKIVAQVARNVGFTGELLRVAVAIAKAESSWDATAYNPEADFFKSRGVAHPNGTNEGSSGLWQIFRGEHPEFEGWDLTIPQINACAMSMIWYRAGKSFDPWSTYRILPAAYLKYLPDADAAVAQLSAP